MKVLHITNWYPNVFNNLEALWVMRHVDSIRPYACNFVMHFNIKESKRLKFNFCDLEFGKQIIIELPIKKWFILEILYGIFLFYIFLVKRKHKEYDVINFHIAYPMLTYWHLIKCFINKPCIITEHWSAYHFNFGVNYNLPRIQNIFRQNIPIITISNALSNDLKNFAKLDFNSFVIPNVVDKKLFFSSEGISNREPFLFLVSQWKLPKTPIMVMQAFLESEASTKYDMIIGGYGPEWVNMKNFVSDYKVSDKIHLIGNLESSQIADLMQRCTAFLHPSDYETFSVVCAEAVACGAYVIAPNRGGIPEVVGSNGHLIEDNILEDWKNALNMIPENFKSNYDGRFESKIVGKKYLMAYKEIIANYT